MKHFKICRVRCLCCGDVIEHINHTKDDNSARVMYCSCRQVGLDPSASLYRVVTAEGANFEDLSEERKEEEKDNENIK